MSEESCDPSKEAVLKARATQHGVRHRSGRAAAHVVTGEQLLQLDTTFLQASGMKYLLSICRHIR